MDPPKVVYEEEIVMDVEFRKEFFYNLAANTSVRLQDDKILKFNKESLISHSSSSTLYQMFMGQLANLEITNIPDVDYDTFKLFLDCIMEFDSYTFQNCLKIFPVVWKYQIDSSIEHCMTAFKLEQLSDAEHCELLNLMAFYYSDINSLLIKHKDGFSKLYVRRYNILDQCCDLLQPWAVKLLLENMNVDSFVLKIITNWATNYNKNSSNGKTRSKTLRTFLEKYNLLQFFKLEYFETSGAVIEFCRSEPGKKLFSDSDVVTHLQSYENLTYGKIEWKKIKKDETIEEEIIIPLHPKDDHYYGRLQIGKNEVVFYDDFIDPNQSGDIWHQTFGTELIRLEVIAVPDNVHNKFCKDSGTIYYWDQKNYAQEYVYHKFYKNPCIKYQLKLKWTFLHDCRVLLVNRQGDKLNGSGKMYFSKDVMLVC